MSSTRFQTVTAFGLFLLLVTPICADPPERGAVIRDDALTTLQYRKKWAVVVGINYAAAERKALNKGEIGELRNAENDAHAVAALLKAGYGFGEDEVILLTGKAATKAAVEALLREGLFCDKVKVKAEDCVLFYFSGHGFVKKTADGKADKGYLQPFDVVMDRDTPNTATAIDAREEAEYLNKHCLATHKLLILDCCYAGAVFQGGYNTSDNEFGKVDRNLFRSPACQVMAASRLNEPASDGTPGTGGHSPFTQALLRGLNSLPRRNPRFTTSTLFRSVQMHMDRAAFKEGQQPLCRWLDGNGEFHFLPDSQAVFEKDLDPRKTRALLLAMVPTAFGNWWMDEAPWFMPGLRFEILAEKPESRNNQEEINLKLLEKIARELVARELAASPEQGRGVVPVKRLRFEHLKRLLKPDSQEKLRDVLARIVEELVVRREDLEAPDLHFLAVLQHKLLRATDAGPTYEAALKKYADGQAKYPEYGPLLALCTADLGFYWFNVSKYDQAARAFHRAGLMYDGESPAPFRVFTLCREADAWRRNGNSGLSDDRMDKALAIARVFDRDEVFHLSAATWKQAAWASMEQWRFREAEEAFTSAGTILAKPTLEERFEARIDRFHVEHGLAMVQRFRGDALEALRRYRRLTPQVATTIRALDARREQLDNYVEIRALFVERLMNSLERQGDCSLFAERPDCAEAADDYRRALRECPQIPPQNIPSSTATLLYKRAIALCLGTETKDQALAARLRAEADQLVIARDRSPSLTFMARLAHSLAHCFQKGDCPADALDELRRAIEDHRKNFKNFDMFVLRDDLETMMFAARLLIEQEVRLLERGIGDNPHQLADDVQMLLNFCRLAQRTELPVPETLKYLRPYYDAAFAAKVALGPKHAKELIEVAWEATRGSAYAKPAEVTPLLALHHAHGKSYLLLDVPSGPSKFFRLDEEYDAAKLQAASREGGTLILPDDVRKALRPVRGQLTVRWHDPVHPLGYERNPGTVSASPGTNRLIVLFPAARAKFPFDLERVLTPETSHKEDLEGTTFYRNPQAGAPGSRVSLGR